MVAFLWYMLLTVSAFASPPPQGSAKGGEFDYYKAPLITKTIPKRTTTRPMSRGELRPLAVPVRHSCHDVDRTTVSASGLRPHHCVSASPSKQYGKHFLSTITDLKDKHESFWYRLRGFPGDHNYFSVRFRAMEDGQKDALKTMLHRRKALFDAAMIANKTELGGLEGLPRFFVFRRLLRDRMGIHVRPNSAQQLHVDFFDAQDNPEVCHPLCRSRAGRMAGAD